MEWGKMKKKNPTELDLNWRFQYKLMTFKIIFFLLLACKKGLEVMTSTASNENT